MLYKQWAHCQCFMQSSPITQTDDTVELLTVRLQCCSPQVCSWKCTNRFSSHGHSFIHICYYSPLFLPCGSFNKCLVGESTQCSEVVEVRSPRGLQLHRASAFDVWKRRDWLKKKKPVWRPVIINHFWELRAAECCISNLIWSRPWNMTQPQDKLSRIYRNIRP